MKPLLQKNSQEHQPTNKKNNKHRHSADTPQYSPPKLSLEHKKMVRREVYLYGDWSKKENTFTPKSKLHSTMTAKTSLNATKANSPFKISSKCNNLMGEVGTSAKDYKFFYQIGLGAFGKVWKVQ